MTASNTTEDTFELTATDLAAVKAVPDRISDAWDANDHRAFAAAYTDSATMILSGDRFVRGRAEILTEVERSFATAHKGTSLVQNIVDVRGTGPDSAVLITDGGVLAPGETTVAPEREIRATWVLTRQRGEWLIAAYQNTRNADGKLPGA
jgi:uncharacterized protein (TIGR02246 family)